MNRPAPGRRRRRGGRGRVAVQQAEQGALVVALEHLLLEAVQGGPGAGLAAGRGLGPTPRPALVRHPRGPRARPTDEVVGQLVEIVHEQGRAHPAPLVLGGGIVWTTTPASDRSAGGPSAARGGR